jgi:hypothetical protein
MADELVWLTGDVVDERSLDFLTGWEFDALSDLWLENDPSVAGGLLDLARRANAPDVKGLGVPEVHARVGFSWPQDADAPSVYAGISFVLDSVTSQAGAASSGTKLELEALESRVRAIISRSRLDFARALDDAFSARDALLSGESNDPAMARSEFEQAALRLLTGLGLFPPNPPLR